MAINLRVVDLYHGDEVTDWAAAKASGIIGIIHKSSQGGTSVDNDSTYASRRAAATAAGFLWGCYHFMTNAPADQQAAAFLKAADPDPNTLVAVDFEPNGDASPTLTILRQLLQILEGHLGRKCVIYSGSLLKETLGGAHDTFLGSHRLWLPEYAATWKLAPLIMWAAPWLWQFSENGHVPGIPGSQGGVDCSSFDGTNAELTAQWCA